MIRIITNTTYGFDNGSYIEPKTKDSAPFSADAEKEADLVERGIAEYVGEKAMTADKDEEVEKKTHEEAEDVTLNLMEESFEVTREYLQGLNIKQMKQFAAQLGLEKEVGESKETFAKRIYDYIDEMDDDEEEPPKAEDDGGIITNEL